MVGGKLLQAGRQLGKLWLQLLLSTAGLHALQGGSHRQLHQVTQVLLIHGTVLHCHKGVNVALPAPKTKLGLVGVGHMTELWSLDALLQRGSTLLTLHSQHDVLILCVCNTPLATVLGFKDSMPMDMLV